MSEHTPGPWEWAKNAMGNVYTDLGSPLNDDVWPVLEAEDYYVCMSDANARLIAAAPELLAVVEELVESADYWSEYFVPIGIVDRMKGAIAKARGGENDGNKTYSDVDK